MPYKMRYSLCIGIQITSPSLCIFFLEEKGLLIQLIQNQILSGIIIFIFVMIRSMIHCLRTMFLDVTGIRWLSKGSQDLVNIGCGQMELLVSSRQKTTLLYCSGSGANRRVQNAMEFFLPQGMVAGSMMEPGPSLKVSCKRRRASLTL